MTIRSFRSKPLLLVEAAGAVLAASLAVRFLPFRRAILLGAKRLPARGKTYFPVKAVCEAIDVVSDHVPVRAMCIERGIAAQWMLRRRGIDARLRYGISLGEEKLQAHVWVTVSDVAVIGGDEAEGFAIVATFPGNAL